MTAFFNSIKALWTGRSVRVRSITKLVLVVLAWTFFDEWGLGVAPLFNTLWLAVGMFFCLRLGSSWKFWVVFIPAGYLLNFYSGGYIFSGHWSSLQFSNLLFFVPTVAFIKRAIFGK